MVSYRHPAGWGLCIPAPSIWCLLSSHWLVCRSTHLIGWHSFFHPLIKRCYWWTQSWNAAALETTVDDAVGWQGKGLGIAGDQKRGFWARWDPENGLFLVQHNFKVKKQRPRSLTINFFCGNLRVQYPTIGFQVFSRWQQRKTRQWTATPATNPLGGNKAARAEATRVTKVLVEARTSPTPKTDQRVNQTVASWRMASAAQGLQAMPPTGDILASKQSPKQITLFNV